MIDLFKIGEEIILSYQERSWGGISFEHWFVTNGKIFLEFGAPDTDIYSARVTINTAKHIGSLRNADGHNRKLMDSDVHERMRHVIGVRNYSLCLRNCEHVANYVFRGIWVSFQMNNEGVLMKMFRYKFAKNEKPFINSFPALVRPHLARAESSPIYTFIKPYFTFTGFDYYLDDRKIDTYNILMVGPTGHGKSLLINILFNKKSM